MIFAKYFEKIIGIFFWVLQLIITFIIKLNSVNILILTINSLFLGNATYFLVIDDVMELHYGRSNVKMQFFTS